MIKNFTKGPFKKPPFFADVQIVMGSGVKSRVRVGFGCHPLGFGSGSGVGPRVPFGFRVFSGFKK